MLSIADTKLIELQIFFRRTAKRSEPTSCQNYPIPPCGPGEKLPDTTLRAQFVQIGIHSHTVTYIYISIYFNIYIYFYLFFNSIYIYTRRLLFCLLRVLQNPSGGNHKVGCKKLNIILVVGRGR